MKKNTNQTIGIVGLGYVGLPLAVEFGKKYKTIGYDIDDNRIKELRNNFDSTLEVSSEDLSNANKLVYTSDLKNLTNCNIYIVSVPTPVDRFHVPDLRPLISASESIGKLLNIDDVVIYESTVYPGCTEEVCVPILEEKSGLKYNEEFYCGYSPERINPGDTKHTLRNIVKVTSGSTPKVAKIINNLYGSIIEAGTHLASSIRVAEAAKVIENVQRDVNIALINELAMIFNKLDIDTSEVLEASGTKWNFLPFRPGLVGGHCIGVDPYYLTYKAKEINYHPEMILAGRRTNDRMADYIADSIILEMSKLKISPSKSKVGVLGITFKENCPDVRNTKVPLIINKLNQYGCNIFVSDPYADPKIVKNHYGVDLLTQDKIIDCDVLIFAVAHNEFKNLDFPEINLMAKESALIIDIKSMFDAKKFEDKNLSFWRL